MLLAGISCVIATEVYCAVLQHVYQDTDNRVGKGFAILGIYIFVVCYCESVSACLQYLSDNSIDALINSVTWLYGAEVMPVSVRSKMVGLSAVAHYVVNVARKSTTSHVDNTILIQHSHASWSECIHEHPRKLLLCLCWMLRRVSGHYLSLLPRGTTPLFYRSSRTHTLMSKQTKQRTLEEIASAFGDKVVTVKDDEMAVNGLAFDEKAGLQHVEEKA